MLDGLVNRMQWDQEPLSRFDGIAKTVVNRDVDLRALEYLVEEVLHAHTVDVVQLVGGHHFNIGQKVGGVFVGVSNARLYLPPVTPIL